MPLVSLVRQNNYELPTLRKALISLLEPLAGMRHFVKRGDRVVLKLNLVCPTRQCLFAYTQAEIFQVVAELAIDCGARVVAGDSPGASSASRVAKIAGITAIAEKIGVPIIEFTPQENFSEQRVFKKLTLARELLDADVVINLPRLKTHGQMLLTAGVKNLFGAVIGTEKFAWHSRAGTDYFSFAKMLYEIYRAIAPSVTILDAIVAMDGEGPTAGDANPLGFLAAAADAVALDSLVMKILRRDPRDLYTIQAAEFFGDTAWQTAEFCGVGDLNELSPVKWRWAASHSLLMIPPRFWRFIPGMTTERYRQLTAFYPRLVAAKCVRCGSCVTICPAKAIRMTGNGLQIMKEKCIRCYCCHELCPQHAFKLQGGYISTFIRFLNRCWQKI